MIKKLIIFDFDGTIADTLDSLISIINRLSSKFGYRKVNEEDVNRFRNQKPWDIFKSLNIPMFKLLFIGREVKTELNKEMESSSIKPTINREILLKLKQDGYNLGILTSNSKDNVNKFLIKHNLDLFSFIYSVKNIFGKSKTMNNVLKFQNIKPGEVVYVGDEARDIEAARKSKVKIIAVSWGFNSKKILKEHSPDFLINKPKELVETLKRMRKPV